MKKYRNKCNAIESFKAQAKRLHAYLDCLGHGVQLGQCLEGLSRAMGARSWFAHEAALSNDAKQTKASPASALMEVLSFKPLLTSTDAGPENSLYEMMRYFYISHDIDAKVTDSLCKQYVAALQSALSARLPLYKGSDVASDSDNASVNSKNRIKRLVSALERTMDEVSRARLTANSPEWIKEARGLIAQEGAVDSERAGMFEVHVDGKYFNTSTYSVCQSMAETVLRSKSGEKVSIVSARTGKEVVRRNQQSFLQPLWYDISLYAGGNLVDTGHFLGWSQSEAEAQAEDRFWDVRVHEPMWFITEYSSDTSARRIADYLSWALKEQDALDELVYEAVLKEELAAANEHKAEDQQEAIIEAAEKRASTINNEGLVGQTDYLIELMGVNLFTKSLVSNALLQTLSSK